MFFNEYMNVVKWWKQDRIAAYTDDFKRFVVSHRQSNKAKNKAKKRKGK